jgi:hypothetical protein
MDRVGMSSASLYGAAGGGSGIAAELLRHPEVLACSASFGAGSERSAAHAAKAAELQH